MMGAWIEKGRAANRGDRGEWGEAKRGDDQSLYPVSSLRELSEGTRAQPWVQNGSCRQHTRVLAFTIYGCQTRPPRAGPRQKLHTSEKEDGMKANCHSNLDHRC